MKDDSFNSSDLSYMPVNSGVEENNNSASENSVKDNFIQAPTISLPKGGGALKSIDDKFDVNASNGTTGLNIPFPLSSGRNGFTPSISLSYSSGGGNSAFGLGWDINLPIIKVENNKKLPEYKNGKYEDTFLFTGFEELVPYLEKNALTNNRDFKEFTNGGYHVKRYRPRIEGEFARIEKISHRTKGAYWKVTTKDNVVTFYGCSKSARIYDPFDDARIFQWLPEFSYNDNGNWILYKYKKDTNIGLDGLPISNNSIPNTVFEKNRKSGLAAFTNVYLKNIVYGNKKPYYPTSETLYDPVLPTDAYYFELVFDFGEHDELIPQPMDNSEWNYRKDAFSSYRSGFEIRTNRLCRRILMFHHFKDEHQVLGYTNNNDKITTEFGDNYLVRSLDFKYTPSTINDKPNALNIADQAEAVTLTSIIQNGYIKKENGSYSKKSLPALEFEYQKLNWNNKIKNVDKDSIINAPEGLSDNYQWVDLYGEGISGILTEQGDAWHYKNNLGDKNIKGEISFTNAQKVISGSSFKGLSSGVLTIQDLEGNGKKQIVVNDKNVKGFFEFTDEGICTEFQEFKNSVNLNVNDPNIRLIDLNGDGKPELLVSEEDAFVWYPSDGKNGYLFPEFTIKNKNEENGPQKIFSNSLESVFLADMSGDGLTDIVRIRNGEICYWANMGYGKFSPKVTMDNSPYFDRPDLFNTKFLHIADISGTGTTDVIYVGKNKLDAYLNLSGNAWSKSHSIDAFFPIDKQSRISVIDLFGAGTSCIVWSSNLPDHSRSPMRYIDLMDSRKPHVLIGYKNNLGKEIKIEYKSSTHYYLKDKLEGKPWITKLNFPVQVVSKIITTEKITEVRFATEYFYHHGYYDHFEKEFRGFGRVDKIDTEIYSEWAKNNITSQLEKNEELFQQPVLTKTWFHVGAFLDRLRILNHYEDEYWYSFYNKQFPNDLISVQEPNLNIAFLSPDVALLPASEFREALRACKGMVLRQEVFALDAPETSTEEELKLQLKPFSVACHNCYIGQVQSKNENSYGVFLVTERESFKIEYERNESDPRISHTLNIEVDSQGNILEFASIVYGRNQVNANKEFLDLSGNVTDFSEDVLSNNSTYITKLQGAFATNLESARNEQLKTHIIYTVNRYAKFKIGTEEYDDIDLPDAYRTRVPFETRTYDLTGYTPEDKFYKSKDFSDFNEITEIGYHQKISVDKQKRLIEHVRSKYLKDDLTALDFGYFDTLGLPYENYQLAFTPELLTDIYSKQDSTELRADGILVKNFIESMGGYSLIFGDFWIRSGIAHYRNNSGEPVERVRERFFSPVAFENPMGELTRVSYDIETFSGDARNNDGYYLYVRETRDGLNNISHIDVFNYRTLLPSRLIDINANPASVLYDELGMVKASAIEGNGIYSDSDQLTVILQKEADNLAGLKEYSELYEAVESALLLGASSSNNTNTTQLRASGNNLLKQATKRFIYDVDVYQNLKSKPVVSVSITREEHFTDNTISPIQFSFEYIDGMGKVVMAKAQANPGVALYVENENLHQKDTGIDLRWIGNGRTILNNKGKAVKKYEPYFSTNFLFEDASELIERGVTPINYYDAPGRLVKTILPNGTFSHTKFDAWKSINYDSNDNVLESEWYNLRINNLIDAELLSENKDPEKEKYAAQKAAEHANTPVIQCFDSLGRAILSISNNGKDSLTRDRLYTNFTLMDIEGNVISVSDARGNVVVEYKYDILSQRVYQKSMDMGERWAFNNLLGNPLVKWDNRNHVIIQTYDSIQRPLETRVTGGDGETPLNNVFDRMVYGEDQLSEFELNLRGQIFSHYDTAGKIQNNKFDYKGNLLESAREFNSNYKSIPDWVPINLNNPSVFDTQLEKYLSSIKFDALNRSTQVITSDGSIVSNIFNETGSLTQIGVTQPGSTQSIFVKEIDYDAKGQRQKIVYGNSLDNDLSTTTYQYDKETFCLIHMRTTKMGGEILQDLFYTYDPVGNIIEVEDKAIPRVFFNNQKIEGKGIYSYDALYRLIRSEGREHAGQALSFDLCDNWSDVPFLKKYSALDEMAWRNYIQNYRYDPVGNILQINHVASGGAWTRNCEYEENNNRINQTQVGSQTYLFTHHPQHGFITKIPHLDAFSWNFKDELNSSSTQSTCTGVDSEKTYYMYNSKGERVRKVTENVGGTKKQERIYLGNTEIFKKYSGGDKGLERTTLKVFDDKTCVAMIDTRNSIDDGTEQNLIRYQYANHLGSSALELNDNGNVISYEEYHPFGTTSYQAVSKDIKAAAKRYRFTFMERDEETGLNYHTARYYIPWLGRWLSSDPVGIEGGLNLYEYCRSNPVKLTDPGGTDPPEDDAPAASVSVTPLLTRHRLSLSGDPNAYSDDSGTATGQFSLQFGGRGTFLGTASVPSLSLNLNTSAYTEVEGEAEVDTEEGTADVNLTGGAVLGTVGSGLNLVTVGHASLQLPVSNQLVLGRLPNTFMSGLPQATGTLALHGSLNAGSFSLATFDGSATLDAGEFTAELQARSFANIARLDLQASGMFTPQGQLSYFSATGSVQVVPILRLDFSGQGTNNGEGGMDVSVAARARLFGIPSLHITGSGTVSPEGANLEGSVYGYIPPLSYVTGGYSLSTDTGIDASAHVFGLTYTPSIDITNPSPFRNPFGSTPSAPEVPSGLTLGYSYTNYSNGGLLHFSVGAITNFKSIGAGAYLSIPFP